MDCPGEEGWLDRLLAVRDGVGGNIPRVILGLGGKIQRGDSDWVGG